MLVVVVLFSSLEVFKFPGYFFLATGTPPRLLRPVKASTGSEFYPGYFGCFTFARLFCHSFIASATVLSGHFLSTGAFLTYAPSPTFLARFVTQMWAGIPHPESSSVPALTELSLPAGAWT